MMEGFNMLVLMLAFTLPCVLQLLLCRYAKSWIVRLMPILAVGGLWLLSVLEGFGVVELIQLESLTTAIHIDLFDLFPFLGIPLMISIGLGFLISFLLREMKDDV